jgi:epoxyqueuosine reductase
VKEITYQEISEILTEYNLKLIGHTDTTSLEIDKQRLSDWQQNGFAAGMEYMKRDPALLSNPSVLFPEAKTVLSISLDYGSEPHLPVQLGYGQVARYAWGRDYHNVFKEVLSIVSDRLKVFGEVRFYSDAVPLLERALAARTGGAFIGKNSLAIIPKQGSLFLMAEIFCSFKITPPNNQPISQNKKNTCGTCTRCISNCPTNAIVTDYVVDAGKCISYLTIEHRGAFTKEQSSMIGDWVFGCDICQDVCPYNFVSLKKKRLGSTILKWIETNKPRFQQLNLEEILSFKTNRQFEDFFQGSPILRARRSGLQRNARAVLLNQGCVTTE